MYIYQTQILLKENYDFSKVKPEGQKQLTELSGYDFSLVDVVQYLKKVSKNFTENQPFPEEIDRTIVKIVESHHSDTQTPNPLKKEDSGASNAKQISDIEDLISTLKDLEGNEEAENLIEILQDTLVSLKNQ